MTGTRRRNLEAVIERHAVAIDELESARALLDPPIERFVLVGIDSNPEAGPTTSLTLHASLEEAGAFQVRKEASQSCTVDYLMDLDTGMRYRAERRIVFER